MTLKNLSRRHCGRCQSEVSRFKKQKFTIKIYYLQLTTILDIHSSLRKYCDYVKFAEMAGNKDLKWPYAAPGQRHTHCCLKVVLRLSLGCLKDVPELSQKVSQNCKILLLAKFTSR